MSATFVGMPAFPEAAPSRARRHPAARTTSRHATAPSATSAPRVVAEVADWEELRRPARRSRTRTLRHLDSYLVQLEAALTARRRQRALGPRRRRGLRDRRRRSPRRHGVDEVVKVKSMATQEIGLNEALAGRGHRRLGDRPGRADRPARRRPAQPHPGPGDPPQPRRDPRDLPRPGWPRPAGRRPRASPTSPAELAAAARLHLREKFLRAKVGGLRRELRGRRDRHAGRGRVRGQRPDVPDPARGADLAWSASRRSCPPGTTSTSSCSCCRARRTGERMNPYTSMWTGRHARRRAAGGARRAAGQRPHRRRSPTRSAARRCAASAARPA